MSDNKQNTKVTEDILFRLGFEIFPNDIPTYVKGFGKIMDGEFEYAFCIYKDAHGDFYSHAMGKKVIFHSVNQLQNLYSAITEELFPTFSIL